MTEPRRKQTPRRRPKIAKSLARSAVQELERRKCRENPYYFATHYCYTLDSDDTVFPSKLFPDFEYLKNLLSHLIKREDIHIEKSRQMLASWTIMIFFLHQVLFEKNRQMLVISSKQDNVDDGGAGSTPQSLLGKARFCYSLLPSFLKKTLKSAEALSFKNLLITNPVSGSSIKGESSSPNAGRGGNYNYALLDEAAFIPNSESVYTSTRLACKKGLIICSTPNGKGNIHWRIKYGSAETGFMYVRLHWTEHPLRGRKWYEQRCKSMTDVEIARELDIDYEGSAAGRIYTEFEYSRHIASFRLIFDPSLPFYTTWDFGIGDPTAILFIQTDPDDKILVIDEFEDRGKDSSFYASRVISMVESWGYAHEDAVNIIRKGAHYADPSGASRGPRLESWIGDLNQRLGIRIQTKPGVSKLEKINRVKYLLKSGKVLISPHCAHFIEALQNYFLETDKNGSVSGERPVHNWASHINDSFQEFCINRFPRNANRIETFRVEI